MVVCLSREAEAVSRSFRNGQKNEVYVHHFLAHNTIEERMLEICKGKQEMADSYLEGTAETPWETRGARQVHSREDPWCTLIGVWLLYTYRVKSIKMN